jgi:myo-inositol-1(or 4)-monophosphatase
MNYEHDLHKYLETAVIAARQAGSLQREKLWSELAIDFKGEKNLVTEVDRACEEMIVATLRSKYPESDVLAEEESYTSYSSNLKWIIDPLDGTTNYAHGFPWFCVSIALEIDGELRLGVIYHPMMDELFTTLKGEGAFLNGSRLKVSTRQPLKSCLLATGFPYDKTRETENNFEQFVNFQLSARAVRRAGAAALDLAYVAAGRLDGYWECKIKPWDIAAGKLLVEESGGKVTGYSGEPSSLYDHRILASNGFIHGEMVELLAFKDRFPAAG